ncbi:uncharacterized protein DUF3141 [Nitrospirillum amazonense]|uniref:Uncharacterized protein DUF3141 n=1 Tax=Nitrospirillum amazonense TaxID=28077 RepID=A0A560KPZ1_9PROT|nr:DUF3141 domain-containing protein [Nitrospirillum amazonense]TWB82720.1 uncharacterized protein DUF3141 [Nitrospirillum amazonense]
MAFTDATSPKRSFEMPEGFLDPTNHWPFRLWQDGLAYTVDAFQRTALVMDVLRQRGAQYHEHMAQTAPTVLSFESETVLDGATLPRPVNYSLQRIIPPAGVELDLKKRPFVIVDPRAGHGPGIGGFKSDSEIGVALAAGHPCYFIGFLPRPVPGQTVEDVIAAEAACLEKVIALHPEAEGKPVVIGNCQAGWQLMMTAAIRPDLFGPIIIAGTPLSFWAGHRGQDPMRYSGGLLGGSWLTAFASDLGAGLFDGAWLVQNFENLNPANTLVGKQYALWDKVDTEAPRYLGFEKWWNGHVLLNGEEIQYIVDKLFVGNRLATADIVTKDGVRVDLRAIRSPIIVFCSKGDNISPPPQALGWICDLYESVDDIRCHGQTIVYAVHESVGHLGIFVSAAVARKEHREFASNIDFIDVLPPGLYEAQILPAEAAPSGQSGQEGDPNVLRFAARSINDVAAHVEPLPDDERRFATVSRLSRVTLGLYRDLVQPWVRQLVGETTAEILRSLHPLRLSYELFSDTNPWLNGVPELAAAARRDRRPVGSENIWRNLEQRLARQMETALDVYRDRRDATAEALFMGIYGHPLTQALFGLNADDAPPRSHPGETPEHRRFLAEQGAELRRRLHVGGLREAGMRALLHVALAERMADARGFNALRALRDTHGRGLELAEFKRLVRDQFLMLLLDPAAALETLPDLLAGATVEEITRVSEDLVMVAGAAGPLDTKGQERLDSMVALFQDLAARAPRAPGKASPAATAPAPDTSLPNPVLDQAPAAAAPAAAAEPSAPTPPRSKPTAAKVRRAKAAPTPTEPPPAETSVITEEPTTSPPVEVAAEPKPGPVATAPVTVPQRAPTPRRAKAPRR